MDGGYDMPREFNIDTYENNEKTLKQPNDLRKGYFIQADKTFPVCNHTFDANEQNIGYCSGIFCDGNPFEAELWISGNKTILTVIMPELMLTTQMGKGLRVINQIEKSEDADPDNDYIDESLLWIDMVNNGKEDNSRVLEYYIDYLIYNNVLSFINEVRKVKMDYCIDSAMNELAHINIIIKENGIDYVQTALEFIPFISEETEQKFISIVRDNPDLS